MEILQGGEIAQNIGVSFQDIHSNYPFEGQDFEHPHEEFNICVSFGGH